MNAAAAVAFGAVITSFPTLYPKTLSYWENASIVRRYWSCKLVSHAGWSRLMEPVSGSDRSMLERRQDKRPRNAQDPERTWCRYPPG